VTGIASRARQESNSREQAGESGIDVSVVCSSSTAPFAQVDCSNAPVAGIGSTVTVTVTEPFTFFTPIIGNMFASFRLGSSTTGFLLGPVNGAVPTPGPTPVATPTPEPTPTPTPQLCIVPNMVERTNATAATAWVAAGFVGANLTPAPGNSGKTIKGQSLGANTNQPCLTATVKLN
jgi:hypothetical protein